MSNFRYIRHGQNFYAIGPEPTADVLAADPNKAFRGGIWLERKELGSGGRGFEFTLETGETITSHNVYASSCDSMEAELAIAMREPSGYFQRMPIGAIS